MHSFPTGFFFLFRVSWHFVAILEAPGNPVVYIYLSLPPSLPRRSQFKRAVSPGFSLLSRAFKNQFVIPEFGYFGQTLRRIFDKCKANDAGEVRRLGLGFGGLGGRGMEGGGGESGVDDSLATCKGSST